MTKQELLRIADELEQQARRLHGLSRDLAGSSLPAIAEKLDKEAAALRLLVGEIDLARLAP